MCHCNVFWGNPSTNADMIAEMQRLWILEITKTSVKLKVKIAGVTPNIILMISCKEVVNLLYLDMVHLMTSFSEHRETSCSCSCLCTTLHVGMRGWEGKFHKVPIQTPLEKIVKTGMFISQGMNTLVRINPSSIHRKTIRHKVICSKPGLYTSQVPGFFIFSSIIIFNPCFCLFENPS
jgi:hypothetical protein